MGKSGGDKKVASGLVAISCAAVLAVYSAGYSRTRAAASQLEAQSAERRPAPSPAANSDIAVVEVAAVSPAPPAIEVSSAPLAAPQPEPKTTPKEIPAAVVEAAPAAEVAPIPAPVAPVAPPSAVAPPPPVAPAPAAPAPKWRDGSFTGWGSSRHGDIQALVVIEGGRIQEATIAECLTRYSCDVIDMLPPQVAARQSADVDYVSRATESANAFYYAVVEALGKAAPPK